MEDNRKVARLRLIASGAILAVVAFSGFGCAGRTTFDSGNQHIDASTPAGRQQIEQMYLASVRKHSEINANGGGGAASAPATPGNNKPGGD
ncbi:MAG: hypothetical protein ACLQVD_16980 [Capsulimonadaceae bacterium]